MGARFQKTSKMGSVYTLHTYTKRADRFLNFGKVDGLRENYGIFALP